MPTSMHGLKNGRETYWFEYSDDELKHAWSEDGQGHANAIARGETCHVVKCSENEAVALSRLFVSNVFAIPTCCHYDGITLSMYCGDAGRGCGDALKMARALVPNVK